MTRSLVTRLVLAAVLFGHVGGALAQESPAAKSSPATAVVNLNTATAAQMATLPGIGATTAQRIIEHREKQGGFKKIEELMNVKGIGEKSFLKLKPLVTVGDGKLAGKE
jgi:competence protein ComEA